MSISELVEVHLGQRPDLPTYLGGWIATLAWMYVVGDTVGDTSFVWMMTLLTTIGFGASFWLRGLRDTDVWPSVERGLLRVSVLLRVGFFVCCIVPAAIGIPPFSMLIPELARGTEEWLIGSIFVWGMTLHSFGLTADGLVAFSSVLGISMLGLMGGENINPEVGVAFLVFLLGNMLMLSNMALTHYAGRRHSGPTGRALARWLGDQFIVAGLTVSATAMLGIVLGALMQLALPSLHLPSVRMPTGGQGQGGPGSGSFVQLGEQMELGVGGGLPAATPVFNVKCSQALLWRRRVYDYCTNRNWQAVSQQDTGLRVEPSDTAVLVPTNKAAASELKAISNVAQEITFQAGGELAAAPFVVWFTPPVRGGGIALAVDAYNNVKLAVQAGQVIRVVSQVPSPSAEQLKGVPWVRREEYRNWLQVPTSARQSVSALSTQLASGHNTPFEVAESIKDYLEANFTYDATVRVPDDEPSVMGWYLDPRHRRGACDLIASAMALLARSAGIPARIASGFNTGEPQTDGSFEVRLSDAHAWAELYFPGYGWIPYNPAVPGPDQATLASNAMQRARGSLRLRWSLMLAGLLGLWLASYAFREWSRTRPRFDATAAGRVREAYHRIQHALGHLGLERHRHETPREHLRRLSVDRPESEWLTAVAHIAGLYESVRYGLAPVVDGEAEAATILAKALPHLLSGEARRLRRAPKQPRGRATSPSHGPEK